MFLSTFYKFYKKYICYFWIIKRIRLSEGSHKYSSHTFVLYVIRDSPCFYHIIMEESTRVSLCVTEDLLLAIPRELRPAFLLNMPLTEVEKVYRVTHHLLEPDPMDSLNWKNLCSDLDLYKAFLFGDFSPEKLTPEDWNTFKTYTDLQSEYNYRVAHKGISANHGYPAPNNLYSIFLSDDDEIYTTRWWGEIGQLDLTGRKIMPIASVEEPECPDGKWLDPGYIRLQSDCRDWAHRVSVNRDCSESSRVRLILFSVSNETMRLKKGIVDKNTDISVLMDSKSFQVGVPVRGKNVADDDISIGIPGQFSEDKNRHVNVLFSMGESNDKDKRAWCLRQILILDPRRLYIDDLIANRPRRIALYEKASGKHIDFSSAHDDPTAFRTLGEFEENMRRLQECKTCVSLSNQEKRAFPIEVTVPREMVGLPSNFMDRLYSVSPQVIVDRNVIACLSKDRMSVCRVSEKCALVNQITGKRLCTHEMHYGDLVTWHARKKEDGHLCPACHRLGKKRKGNDTTRIDVVMPDIMEIEDIFDMEVELRDRYGHYFLVVLWEGDNPEDRSFELYRFEVQDAYKGFLWIMQHYPNVDPELGNQSTSYVRGYRRAEEQYKLWWNKFASVVFQSAE